MKISSILTPLSLFVLILTSCKKDTDAIILNSGQGLDTTWYTNYNVGMKAVQLKNELSTDFVTDLVTTNSGTNQYTNICNNLMAISFPYNSIVDISGNPYNGQVVIKSKISTNIGSDINYLKSDNDNDNKLLDNIASFYIAIFDLNNNELYIDSNKNISIVFHYDNPPFMPNLYFGSESNLLSSIWTTVIASNLNYINLYGDYVIVNFNETGWVSCGKTYSASQQTKVSINLPVNYTNANTIAYLTVHDRNIALQLQPDVGARQFQSISVPIRLAAKIVVLSKQGNSYFLGHADFNTSSLSTSGGYQEITVTPTITSFANMKDYIDSL